MAWFCLKHRKSVSTLLKLGLQFARKLKDNPWIIEQLTQCAMELVANITPPEPPPRVQIAAANSPTLASKWNRKEGPIDKLLNLLWKRHKSYTPRDSYMLNLMLDI